METLKDPLNDRKVKSLKPPPILPLNSKKLWRVKGEISNLKRNRKMEASKRFHEKRRKSAKERPLKDN